MSDFSDWRGTLKSKTMEVYEKTGIQMYYLYIEIPEEITTKATALTYINDIIKDKFDDPYGFYLVNAHHKDYKNDAYVSFYNEYIYGDYVSTFMDSKALAIYNAAFKKYYDGSPGKYYSSEEFVQESVDEDIQQQEFNVPVQHETDASINDVDLNQYHAYNNEYNEPTYKKPSPIVSVDKDDACNVESTQRDTLNTSPGTVNPVINKIIQDQINKNINETLRLCRNRSYLAPARKLTPEGRYNLYVEQLARKHDQYIDFKLRLNRTINLQRMLG